MDLASATPLYYHLYTPLLSTTHPSVTNYTPSAIQQSLFSAIFSKHSCRGGVHKSLASQLCASQPKRSRQQYIQTSIAHCTPRPVCVTAARCTQHTITDLSVLLLLLIADWMHLVQQLPSNWADTLREMPRDWQDVLASLPPHWLPTWRQLPANWTQRLHYAQARLLSTLTLSHGTLHGVVCITYIRVL